MIKITILIAACIFSVGSIAASSHAVRGHVTKSGAYVAPTRATNPNKTTQDNYSKKGNVNPYNGKQGTKK